jgi:hypothetical protein
MKESMKGMGYVLEIQLLLESESANAELVSKEDCKFAQNLEDVVNDFAYFDYLGKVKLPVVRAAEALSDGLRNIGF